MHKSDCCLSMQSYTVRLPDDLCILQLLCTDPCRHLQHGGVRLLQRANNTADVSHWSFHSPGLAQQNSQLKSQPDIAVYPQLHSHRRSDKSTTDTPCKLEVSSPCYHFQVPHCQANHIHCRHIILASTAFIAAKSVDLPFFSSVLGWSQPFF